LKKRRSKKSRALKITEYLAALLVISLVRVTPVAFARGIGNLLGDALFRFLPRRREIAIENLRHAFPEMQERERTRIARQSCRSFFLTFIEIIKFRYIFSRPDTLPRLKSMTADVDRLFEKAKRIHDESGGCIFVTPHIGNWEVLPHVSAFVGIPLAIVARPLDNEYLERLLFDNRVAGGQVLIPKRNAMFSLQKTLQKGISIGMLPDQSTMKGISIEFFGRPATTTPIPAILAITYKRPIVVTACCRKKSLESYEGFVSDPIYPGEYASEKDEIFRITREITRQMEEIIRRYPDQYLWIHNRWKVYKNKRAVLS
jgi:KDO2-lipid IV(A) lauroyltransferase